MLNLQSVDALLDLAFAEDIGIGDITTESTVSPSQKGRGTLVAKNAGIIAGLSIADRTFRKFDPSLVYKTTFTDGDTVNEGDSIAEVHGSVKSILIAERTALNFLQRLSGVATLTSEFVTAVSDYDVRIVDTRKTTPGWRALQKYAVRVGGGHNHRFGLYDGILIKDNHIVAAGGIRNAINRARLIAPHTTKIEVEVETIEQVNEALDTKADILLLDNMSPSTMTQAVKIVKKRALTEASGGITLEQAQTVAATGVDLISVGALTHSALPIDISLNLTLVEK